MQARKHVFFFFFKPLGSAELQSYNQTSGNIKVTDLISQKIGQ